MYDNFTYPRMSNANSGVFLLLCGGMLEQVRHEKVRFCRTSHYSSIITYQLLLIHFNR